MHFQAKEQDSVTILLVCMTTSIERCLDVQVFTPNQKRLSWLLIQS